MKLQSVSSLFVLVAAVCNAQQINQQHWISTWTTAQPVVHAPPPSSTPAAAPGGRAMSPAVLIARQGLHDQTVRMKVRVSLGGSRVRVRLSNSFGANPVTIGAAHIALHGQESEILDASDRPLLVDGKPSFTIRPGVILLTDPVDLNVPNAADLAVTLYFPEDTGPVTSHNDGHTTYISKQGDLTTHTSIPDAITTTADYWLSGVEVLAPPAASVIVALGDSITEGAGSSTDSNHAWPALLSARLLANKATANWAVANVGIGGNRLLRDGAGASVLARLDRDVLSQPGARWVILMEGINDIGHAASVPAEAVTAEELIGVYKQVIARAHAAGIRVMGGTLTPYEGAGYYSDTGEAVRVALNNWIRTSGECDAVVDFEKAIQEPASPKRFHAEFDHGDHLHPSDAGYEAMAAAFDLAVFNGRTK